MNLTDLIEDPAALAWWLRCGDRWPGPSPAFLVIAPPKTGSTWLAENLRRHPGVHIPAVKEVKYFSSWFRHLDPAWYCEHFLTDDGRLTGEASPSYAPLPLARIRLIRKLMPAVKLIFLMRDPIERAWSHARHNFRFKETNFADCDKPIEEITDAEWLANIAQDWSLASGDYLGQLRRWRAVFPDNQLFIRFYESIEGEPETVLRDVCSFLGIDSDLDVSSFPIRERILPGLACDMPAVVRQRLTELLAARTAELVDYLAKELGIAPPAAWSASLTERAVPVGPPPAAFARADDDLFLARVVATEERFPSVTYPILDSYRDFNIVLDRGRFYGLSESLGRVWPAEIKPADRAQYEADGRCLIAADLAGIKERIDRFIFERTQDRMSELPRLRAELRAAGRRADNLEAELRKTRDSLRNVEAELACMGPWSVFVHRFWRPLRRFLFGQASNRPEPRVIRMPAR